LPIYEYQCNHCKKVFSVLVRGWSAEPSLTCPRCSAHDARRLISRFAVVRSEDSRADDVADMASDLGDVDENDPHSVARWARRMSDEMGEEGGPEMKEMADRLENGESPESIEQSLGAGEAGADATNVEL
jgi:putative FmdB family regulatory protein